MKCFLTEVFDDYHQWTHKLSVRNLLATIKGYYNKYRQQN